MRDDDTIAGYYANFDVFGRCIIRCGFDFGMVFL